MAVSPKAGVSPEAVENEEADITVELGKGNSKCSWPENPSVREMTCTKDEGQPTPPRSRSRAQLVFTGFLTLPCQLNRFLRALYAQFGGYVPVAILQYGVNQGIGMSLGTMARRVYFTDYLHLDGALSGRIVAASMLPWSIKPVFGMLSDAVPLFGFHRTSYLVIAGACGLVAWPAMGLLPLSGLAIVPFFLLINLSVCMPDVMIDASTAELSKIAPEHASNLQSLSWGALALGGLFTCSSSGYLVEHLGPRPIFISLAVGCLFSVLIPGLRNWLGEKRLPKGQRKLDMAWLHKHTFVVVLAAYMSAMAVSLSVLQIAVESQVARGIVTGVCAVVLVVGVFLVLSRVNPVIAKTAIFVFMRETLQPSTGEAMFQWLKDAPDGPHFSPTILSWVDCFGSLGLFLGVTIYNKYLSDVPYRKIFIGAQMAMVVSSLFDYALVKRWNLAVGIPDIVMLIGDDAFTVTMRRFFVMPMFILAAKVCPSNLEATLFAMLMALSNFGSTVSEFLGVSLLEIFGVVGGNFDRLAEVTLSKTFCRLLPILLVPILVPNLKPSDQILPPEKEEKDDEACEE